MAGNKVNAKAKGKDDKGKGSSKVVQTPINDETADYDFSVLRKPIQTSITGFAQARKIFDMATEELKSLISDECDLVYECKVCRNMFRSLANFISHKRVFCREKFNSTIHGHFLTSPCTINELSKIKHIEADYQESLKEPVISDLMETDEVDERVPLTKDLTAVIEKIANRAPKVYINDEQTVTLQKIPSSSVAVFQNIDVAENCQTESMGTQVKELDDIQSNNVAVMQSDGKFNIQSSVSSTDSVIQISDDEDSGDIDKLKCKICEMEFSTQKTLKFHMNYKHVESRLVYPCPDCMEIFSTSWSVYRHLYKVHRKSTAQIRRLRESIQAKAFKMNNPPAFYEKRKNVKAQASQKISEEERIDQENQAWMDNVEWCGTGARCGGCGRTFERRAALAAHAHTCQPRSRALRRPDSKRIEIQIRKDYNKGATPTFSVPLKSKDINENKTSTKTPQEDDSVESEKIPDPIPEEETKIVDENSNDSTSRQSPEEQSSNESPMKTEEPVENTTQDEQPDQAVIRLPFAQHAEKSNLMAFRQRIISDIELEKLRCKKCDTKCDQIQDLYDHVAKHYKWMRYACKLCNFKHYNFEKLPEHVKIVHKLKGDKDYYFSTVKAIDGPEAQELAVSIEEEAETNGTSPNSRRPSRCSSDSSRLSDDSSSSSIQIEGSRKRKVQQSKNLGKRRRQSVVKGNKEQKEDEWPDKDESSLNTKTFEDHSSDIDDAYDKSEKIKAPDSPSVVSRRPVRRKTKPKNEDFEYDLSNLLKMELQGYRENSRETGSTTPTTNKTIHNKKTKSHETPSNYEILNKECCGALISLSRKAVELAKAHSKLSNLPLQLPQKGKQINVFTRPMVPKGLHRSEKTSPKKDSTEEKKDHVIIVNKSLTTKVTETSNNDNNKCNPNEESLEGGKDVTSNNSDNLTATEKNNFSCKINEKQLFNNNLPPPLVPLKFRRQSLDVMQNPIINKNISEFTKAGMKTKILVIKPINRKDGKPQLNNTSLKFQKIKLMENNKSSTNDDNKSTDQVVIVKVPKVDCIARGLPEATTMTVIDSDAGSSTNNKSHPTPGASADNKPDEMETPSVPNLPLNGHNETEKLDNQSNIEDQLSERCKVDCDNDKSTPSSVFVKSIEAISDDVATNVNEVESETTANDTTIQMENTDIVDT